MGFDSALKFYMSHNGAIINWVFLTILGFSLLSLILALTNRDGSMGAEKAESLHDLEKTMRKLLQENKSADAGHGTSTQKRGVEDDLSLIAELETTKTQLKKTMEELAAKEKAMNEMGQNSDAGAPPPTSEGRQEGTAADAVSLEEHAKLVERIKELELKLEEYSVIEDDIADLSLFKEENARLKAELKRVKGEDDGLGAVEPAPASPEVAESAPVADDSSQLEAQIKLQQVEAEAEQMPTENTVDASEKTATLESETDTDKLSQEADELLKQAANS